MDKQEYINELYARYSDKVYAVCMKYLHNEDDAQDIMHDTYITAMNKICGLRKPEKAEKWLCAVAANKCKDYIRKNKPMFDSDGYEYENAAEETYSAENAVIDESVKNDLREIVNSLPTSQKNVVAGFYFESLSVKELARALSCTQSSVKVSLHRARKTIKSKCEQKGITLGGCALGAALTTAAKDAGIKFAASTAVGAGIAAKVVSCIAVAAIVVYGAVGVAHYSGMEIGVFSDSAPEQGDTASGNGDFRYTVYGEDDEYVKIAQYDGDSEAVEFPSEINGAAVKALGDDSLILHPEKVKKVIIPEGVEMIFGNFSGCVNLSEIVLPDTIKYISDKAFCDTAYYKNDENRENGVLYIGKYLIDGKKQVKSDKSSSEYFDEECVSGNVKVKDATLCIAENAFADCDKIASVTMSNSVKYIGSGAFARCTGLSSIKLSDNLTSVENGVFDGCKNLNDISLPKSITSVGESAFCDTGIYNNPNNWENGVMYIGDVLSDASRKTSGGETVRFGGECTVRKGTRIIADCSFSQSNLTEIAMPDSVEYIGDSAFKKCTLLKNAKLSNSLKYIGKNAFEYCTKLDGVAIPARVKTVSERAFHGCEGLISVTIGNGVERIAVQSFANCKIGEISLPDSVNYIGFQAFGYDISEYRSEVNLTAPKLSVKCSKNSAAHKYAKDNGLNFIINE